MTVDLSLLGDCKTGPMELTDAEWLAVLEFAHAIDGHYDSDKAAILDEFVRYRKQGGLPRAWECQRCETPFREGTIGASGAHEMNPALVHAVITVCRTCDRCRRAGR